MRNIHWKSYAKSGKPIVKEFQDEYFVRHALILDTFCQAEESDVFEEAVSVAASFICSVKSQDSLLDLMFLGTKAYVFTAGRGLARTEKMLEILSAVKPCSERSFDSLTSVVLERSRYISGCIIVLVSWDRQRKTLIEELTRTGIPVFIFLIEGEGKIKTTEKETAGDNFYILQSGHIEEGLARI